MPLPLHSTHPSPFPHSFRVLRSCIVKLQPPAPPPAVIQARLRAVGRCVAGYDWQQVVGGWRCAAGGHFVSDAELGIPLPEECKPMPEPPPPVRSTLGQRILQRIRAAQVADWLAACSEAAMLKELSEALAAATIGTRGETIPVEDVLYLLLTYYSGDEATTLRALGVLVKSISGDLQAALPQLLTAFSEEHSVKKARRLVLRALMTPEAAAADAAAEEEEEAAAWAAFTGFFTGIGRSISSAVTATGKRVGDNLGGGGGQASTQCACCQAPFTLLLWKHDCTHCKRSVCAKCKGSKRFGEGSSSSSSAGAGAGAGAAAAAAGAAAAGKRACVQCEARLSASASAGAGAGAAGSGAAASATRGPMPGGGAE